MSPATTIERTPFFEDVVAVDPIYGAIRSGENEYARTARALVESLWQVAAPYVDPDIRRKARVSFHPHWWEMYVAGCLLQAGMPLVPRSRRSHKNAGPDLQAETPMLWIEAVAATGGTGADAVVEAPPGLVHDVPDEGVKLRILSAIAAKVRRLEDYVDKGIVSPTEPCVIAVNTGAVPSGWSEREVPRIVRCLFPLGHEVIEISRHDGRVVGRRHAYQAAVSKVSGATVPTTGFETPEWSRISAVIQSSVDAFNGRSKIGSDFVIVHNPHAANPLPLGFLKLGTEYWVEGESIEGCRWWMSDSTEREA